MSVLFAFLAFFCLILMVIGLVKPRLLIRWGEKRTRFRVILVYGSLFMILSMIGAAMETPTERAAKAEKRQIEQQQKEEQKAAAEKAKTEKAAQEAAEKERKQQEETVEKARKVMEENNRQAETENNYKITAKTIPYRTIARNPDQYKSTIVTYTGRVLQVMESGNKLTFRIGVGTNMDDVFMVSYRKLSTESRILEDDVLTFYGEFKGITKYTTVLDQEISVPEVNARYIVRRN